MKIISALYGRKFVFGLLISLLMWGMGVPGLISVTQAAQLTSYKDTLSTSVISVAANHVLSFTTTTAMTATQTFTIAFDTAGQAFNLASLVAADISATGFVVAASCTGTASEATASVNSGTDIVTFTVCASDTIAAGAITITFGNLHITNPGSTGSYIIRAAMPSDSGDTRVAITNSTAMTASVDTSLTFTISGVASGQTSANGESGVGTTSVTSTSTTIPWGTLTAGTAKAARQDLAVTTNATNGFIVTLQQNQNLLSASGADIDTFKDGASTATPTAWTTPLGTLGTEATYGHYGITSEDADLNSDEFGTALYAGNIGSARTVFSHTGPADGTTANQGATKVGYKIQITGLQEAGSDYANTLVYICTPSF